MKKLHYLLIMPKVAINVNVKYNFPVGIPYLSAAMKQAGFNVTTINPNHTEDDIYTILKDKLNDIDVLLTGGLSGQFYLVKELIDAAKRIKPSLTVIVGGGLITASPEIAMKALENADFGVRGEGELTCVELCRALEQDLDIQSVPSIVYKEKKGNIYIYNATQERKDVADVNALPFPDYEGFDIETYLKLTSQIFFGFTGEKVFFSLTARSCPYHCSFCFHTVGNKYRVRNLDNVFAELTYMHEKYGITDFVLSDELFASDKNRVRLFTDFCNKMNFSWVATFRLDQVDDELIEIIKNSTCKQMFFGIESVNDSILKSMKKHLTREIIEKNLKKVYDANIPFGGNLLFGDVEDTFETAMENINWALAHPEYNLSLINICCYPGTEIYNYAVQKGIIKDEIQFLKDGLPLINLSKMSDEEFCQLQIKILEFGNGIPLDKQEIVFFDKEEKVAKVKGVCKKCHTDLISDNVLLFTTDYSYIYCPKCGVKYRTVLESDMEDSIAQKIENMINEGKSIAFWGVQPSTWSLFNKYPVFAHDAVTFIDTNEGKQLIKITSAKKTIYPLFVLKEKHFDVVVFCYPHLYSMYEKMMETRYPEINNFIDLIDLI